jgi:hypothetical protein
MWNNFLYWNFSKFGIEFELKIKEALGFENQQKLREFDWNFQELMQFEQGAPVCTWMINHLMKRILEFQICEFLSYFKNLIQIHLIFSYFGLLRI